MFFLSADTFQQVATIFSMSAFTLQCQFYVTVTANSCWEVALHTFVSKFKELYHQLTCYCLNEYCLHFQYCAVVLTASLLFLWHRSCTSLGPNPNRLVESQPGPDVNNLIFKKERYNSTRTWAQPNPTSIDLNIIRPDPDLNRERTQTLAALTHYQLINKQPQWKRAVL